MIVADHVYFDVMEMGLVRGRSFTDDDTADRSPVALINQETADRYWPDRDPIGEQIRIGEAATGVAGIEVVGVVENLVYPDPDEPAYPLIYRPLEQEPRAALGLMLRSRGEVGLAATPVRQQIWAIDPEQPVSDVRTMAEIFEDYIAVFDPIFAIFMFFAVFALAMAAAGIYGVMSFAVSERTREFGIRMALGAESRTVRAMVMRGSIWVIGAGALAGLGFGFFLGRVLASGLDGVGGMEPASYGLVAAVLVAAAALSAYIPARRVTRVDPMIALRTE
jgi:hypothetical protein